jgi:hypothetical protein
VATTGLAAVQHRPLAEAQKDDGCEQNSNSLESFNLKVFWIYTHPFDKKLEPDSLSACEKIFRLQ